MKRTALTIGTIAMVTLGSTLFADTTVYAEKSLDEVKNERQEIQSKLTKAESAIADVLYDIKEINEKLDRVEDSLQKNQTQINETEDKIDTYENEIDKKQNEIDALNDKMEERNEILKNRLSSYQDNGGNLQYLEVFLGSKDFIELISRISAVSTITDADMKLLEEQEEDKQAVEDKQDKVEKKLDEQKDLRNELGAIKDTITDQKAEQKKDKAELEKKESELNSKKSNLKSDDKDLAALEAQILAPPAPEKEAKAESEPEAESTNAPTNEASAATKDESVSSTNESSSKSAPKQEATANVAYTGGGGSAISAGKQYIGNSTYVFGGRNASTGQFDCSGFVQWAYQQEGVSLPASTSGMQGAGSKISFSQAQPGDLVFFDTYKKNGHVGIYLGGGNFLGSQSSTGVAIANMSSGYWADNFSGHVRRVK